MLWLPLSFAVFCFVVTLGMHIAGFFGELPSNDTLNGFLPPVMAIGLLTFYFHPDRKRDEPRFTYPWRTLWGFPGWLKAALAALFAYDAWFFWAYHVPNRWSVGAEPLAPNLAQATALVLAWLFAVSSAFLYDWYRRPAPSPF